MGNIIEQMVYLQEVIDAMKDGGSVTLDRTKDKDMIEALEESMRRLLSEKANSDKIVQVFSNDYSLTSCIDYVRNKRTHMSGYLSYIKDPVAYQEAVREIKILGAVDENLVAMSIMADRMAERLLELPSNKMEEAEQHG